MGAPAGHPYAHPEGVCINGLGALPSPYGPTLRGAHNGPSGLQKIKELIVLRGTRSWSKPETKIVREPSNFIILAKNHAIQANICGQSRLRGAMPKEISYLPSILAQNAQFQTNLSANSGSCIVRPRRNIITKNLPRCLHLSPKQVAGSLRHKTLNWKLCSMQLY